MGYPDDDTFAEAHGWNQNRPGIREVLAAAATPPLKGKPETMTVTKVQLQIQELTLNQLAVDIIHYAADIAITDGASHKRRRLQEIVRKIQDAQVMYEVPNDKGEM